MNTLLLNDSDIQFLGRELKFRIRQYWKLFFLFIAITPILPFLPGKVDTSRTVPHTWNEYLYQERLFLFILIFILILIYRNFVIFIKKDLKNGTKLQFDAWIEKKNDSVSWLDSKLNIKNRYVGVIVNPVITQTENVLEKNIFYYLRKNVLSSKIKTSMLKEEFLAIRHYFGTIEMSPLSKKILRFSEHQNDF
jgi:hypothetical protein